jgi:integration host factor subunit beta
MTKSELIARVAQRYPHLAAKDADYAVNTILDAMSEALASGHRIEMRGFGSFALNTRPPRVGRNPKSGEKVLVPEKCVPHFKAGKELRELVGSSQGPAAPERSDQSIRQGLAGPRPDSNASARARYFEAQSAREPRSGLPLARTESDS